MVRNRLVTLLTDFGTRDAYVSAMKGVILSAVADARIVDISHEIDPQDVLGASLVLAEAAPYFPDDTLHVVVVDPGVGTDRRILAGRFGRQLYLFPDNGVITFVARREPLLGLSIVPSPRGGGSSGVSATFHGRDVFAPTAGQILKGRPPGSLGPQPQSYKLLEVPEPRIAPDEVVGEVIYVDHFGNLVSNIPAEMLGPAGGGGLERLDVQCAGRSVGPVRRTYGEVPEGDVLALINSMDLLEIAVNAGRGDAALNAGIGSPVRVVGAG